MLKVNNTAQVVFIGFGVLLLAEFFINVWIGFDAGKKNLNVDGWDKSVLSAKSEIELLPVNEVFGLKAEVDAQAEALRKQKEKDEAERLAREKAELEKRKQEVLTIGEENIRLFGITFSGEQKVALFKIKGMQGNERVLKLVAGEELSLKDNAFVIRIEHVSFDSVQLQVENVKANDQQVISLAMFNYEF